MGTDNNTSGTQTIGVTLSGRMVAGLIADNKLAGPLRYFPEDPEDDALVELPTEGLVRHLCEEILAAAAGSTAIAAVGVALPGFIRNGVVEEAPNLPQLKGTRIQELLANALRAEGLNAQVVVMNDADAVASGLAATRGQLDRLIRVWTLGTGIGYGRYPMTEGVWEGGHTVVTLEDKENYCGCGGRGHLEGVMGQRAMRLRFLDMEPEEVFEAAKEGDPRCLEFKKLWHKALAAATATTFHMAGPGKVYLTGMNVRFVDLPMLKDYVHQMVKMSPLQSYSLEVIAADAEMAEVAVIGAGVTALQVGK
ncbi:MAG TPA: ROK family protein [Acidobacteriaceae bacterium]